MITEYEKLINELRQRSLIKLEEGKEDLTLSGYQLLCRKFSEWIPGANTVGGHYVSSIFICLLTVLIWNLIGRSDYVSCLIFEHVKWEGDCIRIQEQGHGGDKMGAAYT